MSDIDGGVFSRPPEGDTTTESTDAVGNPQEAAPVTRALAKRAPVKRAPVKRASVKKAVKKAAAKKPPVAKKAAALKKAAPSKKVAAPEKEATKRAAPVKRAPAVKRAAAIKKVPATRKRSPAMKGSSLAGGAAAAGVAAGTASGFEPDAGTVVTGGIQPSGPAPGGPMPGGPMPSGAPPAREGGFGFGFEPPAAGSIYEPATQTTTLPAPVQPSRKDRRGAKRAAQGKGKGGKGGALLVAALLLALVAAAVAVFLVLANQDDGTDYADLRVGNCVRDVSARDTGAGGGAERRSVTEVEVVACNEPHETEVYAVTNFPGGKGSPFPGDEAIGRFVSEFCQGPAFEQYVGKPRNLSSLIDDDIQPSDVSWKAGRRQVICMASDPAGKLLTGSVKGSGR